MTIQGNLHGYILKTVEITKFSKALLEQSAFEKVDDPATWEGQLHTNLKNILTLLEGIENLDQREVAMLRQLLQIEHEEGEELHEILSMSY